MDAIGKLLESKQTRNTEGAAVELSAVCNCGEGAHALIGVLRAYPCDAPGAITSREEVIRTTPGDTFGINKREPSADPPMTSPLPRTQTLAEPKPPA